MAPAVVDAEATAQSVEVPAVDVPVVQATFLTVVDPFVVAPPEAVAQDPPEAVAQDPPAGAPEQPVVEAMYMPNFSAVYEKVETSAEIKRLEAHLSDKDKQIADKDAEIKRLEELFRLHLAEKDAALAAKAKQIELLKSAVISYCTYITSTRTRGALCPLGRIEWLSLLQVSCAKLHCKPMARASRQCVIGHDL